MEFRADLKADKGSGVIIDKLLVQSRIKANSTFKENHPQNKYNWN